MIKWLDSKSRLYRSRYLIGYLGIVVAFITLLLTAALYVPGGLSESEQNSFVRSASLDLQNIDSLTIASLPYHIAQRGVVELFGASLISIKLVTIILAIIAGIGAVLLMRRWFKPNIALLATMIMITTGQFIYVAQLGTSAINYILWPVWLLLSATMITAAPQHARFWKLLFFILVPLSLYTPLNIYLVIALISAGLLHPHVRYVLRKMKKWHLATLMFMSLLIIAPLGYLISRDPRLGLELLGMPSLWPPDLYANAKVLFHQYFNFITPHSGALITPILSLGSMALIALGAWRLFKIRYTARSYTLVAWGVLLIPVLLINPSFTTVTFVPLLMLLASGLEFLLRSWYQMFPRNPYARFVGLIPLVILVGGLFISGLNRYYAGYQYDPITASQFSKDLPLLESEVRGKNAVTLVVSTREEPFYRAVASLDKNSERPLTIVIAQPTKLPDHLAATRAAHSRVTQQIERIVTTDRSNDADRFYIYKH